MLSSFTVKGKWACMLSAAGFLLLGAVFFVSDASALVVPGGTGDTIRITDSDRGYSHVYGATWALYQYSSKTGGDLKVPSALQASSEEESEAAQITAPAKCREYGGFYVLVRDEGLKSSGQLTGKPFGTLQLQDLTEMGGNYDYRSFGDGLSPTFKGISDTTGDATVVASGQPLEEVRRLFESMPEDAKNGFEWDNHSTAGLFCYGSEYTGSGDASSVYSTSSVTFGGASQTSDLDGTTTMFLSSSVANASSTVTFTHRIVSAKQPDSGMYNVNINWSVSGDYSSRNNPPSGVLNLASSSEWSVRADGKWEKVVSVSAAVPIGSSGRICQKISYNPKNYATVGESVSSSGSGSSTACVNLRAITPPTPTCAAMGGTSTKNINYGDTNGISKVWNMNNISGDTGWQSTVWARPGDTIQFAHCFSWGVQAVRKSDSYGGGRTTPSEASSLSDRVNESSFTITSDRGSQYLFGTRRDQGSLGQTVTLQRFNSTAYRLGGGYINAEANGNYDLVLMSPSKETTDASRYNCLIFDFTQFINNGFQIPGMTTGGCAASNATGQTNEVGTTISQRITYPYQQAWVYESWYHNGGTCNCKTKAPSENTSVYYNNTNLGYGNHNGSIATVRHGATYWSEILNCYPGVNCSEYQDDLNCPGMTSANGCSCTDAGAHYDHDCSYDECYDTPGGGKTCVHYSKTCTYHRGSTIGNCSGYGSFDVIGTRHPVRFRDYGNRTSVASVNIPYNFRTADTSSINAGSVIYAGESVSSTFTASVLPVINSSIKSTDSAYATVYPGDIRIEQFIIGPNASVPAQTSGVLPIGGGTMCNYFGGTQCGTISINNQDSNWKNAQGRYNGWTWSMSATYNVPNNADIGSKYCVAIGMTIASSHPNADATTVSGWHSFNGNWRVSLSCRTIAKKPNFQAWNANLYATEGMNTTTARKYEGATLGTNSSADKIFGSWEEYLAISKGDINGFASGAALGYEGSTMRIAGGHSTTGNFCDLSHMSVANVGCSSNYAGFSKISLSDATIKRLYSRYLSSSFEINSGESINVASASAVKGATGQSVEEYIATSGNGTISSTIIRSANSPVLVIYVPGTLTINANICSGTGTCQGYDNALVLGSRNSQRFSSLSEIPQAIIIASQINISENVTQIDAWLVALGSPGTVNTCYQFNVGASSSDTCSKTLIVNGPTITNHLLLNRTAGAYTRSTFGQNDRPGAENNLTDDGSITPAEIFNYRPDTILWGYQQSQDFSQATVTYSRELSPRY